MDTNSFASVCRSDIYIYIYVCALVASSARSAVGVYDPEGAAATEKPLSDVGAASRDVREQTQR